MTTKQQPLNSGFDASTTATEVLAGVDLTGKRALVTGGYSGIGLETTRALAAAGARVVVPARRREVADAALAGIDGVTVDEMNLADLGSVEDFTDRLLATGERFDYVIDSAGVMACPETRVGPGWELQFAVNHLGHFALVNRLFPILAEGARVASVSSGGHGGSDIRWNDMHFEGGYERWTAYSQSKTANVLFAVQLDRLAQDRGVRAFSLHPGAILTPLQRHLPRAEMLEAGWIDEDGNAADYFKTTEQGAATQVWAVTSPLLDGEGGVYLQDCDIAEIVTEGQGVREYAIDPEAAERLWEYSAAATGVDAFA